MQTDLQGLHIRHSIRLLIAGAVILFGAVGLIGTHEAGYWFSNAITILMGVGLLGTATFIACDSTEQA